MIYDWKNNKEEALAKGICEKSVYSVTYITMKAKDKVVAHHTFRNFDKLDLEPGALVIDCVFEDCGIITLDECRIEGCSFVRVDTVFANDSVFSNSGFKELVCDNDVVLAFEDCKLSYCVFEDAELREDSYLCDAAGDTWLEHCSFINIRTSRKDKEIIILERTVGKLFKQKLKFSVIDEDSCVGLDGITLLM